MKLWRRSSPTPLPTQPMASEGVEVYLMAIASLIVLSLLPLLLLRRRASSPRPRPNKVDLAASSSLSQLLHQHADAIRRLREVYVRVGGKADEYIEPFLLRFILATAGDEQEAAEWLTETTQWRLRTGAEEVRAKVLEGSCLFDLHPAVGIITTNFPCLVSHGHAHDGGPVSIFVHDGFDPPTLMGKLSPEEYLSGVVAMFEYNMVQCDRRSKELDRLVKITNVFDFDRLTINHLNLRFLTQYTRQFISLDKNYPESFDALLCINAPGLFQVGYRIARPWMSPQFREKISIHSTPEESAEATLRQIPRKHLPQVFGGECAKMPQEVAKRVGYTSIDETKRAKLFSGYKLGGYYA
eukprot:scaffold123264_cov31-Tisochrysis_lutea.AAC.2